MSAQHTPTPWIDETAANPHSSTDGRHYIWSDRDDVSEARCVAIVSDASDAAFIVVACNAHDELVAALREIDHAANHRFANCEPGPMKRMPPELREAIIKARAALAKAGAA